MNPFTCQILEKMLAHLAQNDLAGLAAQLAGLGGGGMGQARPLFGGPGPLGLGGARGQHLGMGMAPGGPSLVSTPAQSACDMTALRV